MKRTVKILKPLDDSSRLDPQILDPRWPQFCSKVLNEEGRGGGAQLQWPASNTDQMNQAQVPVQAGKHMQSDSQQPFPTRFSMPSRQDQGAQRSNAHLSRFSCPSEVNEAASQPIDVKQQAVPMDRDMAQNDSSGKSGCSTASLLDSYQDFGDYRPARSKSNAEKALDGEENDVHAAAKRAIEFSRQQQSLRRPSTPMAIPAKKKQPTNLFKF